MMGMGMQQALLPHLARSLGTSAAAASALVQGAAPKSAGLASLFGFGGSRIETPLSEPLASVPTIRGGGGLTVRPELVSSTLAGGVRVAAIETASPISAIALFVPAGSAYETDATAGATSVLEHLAFKATAHRTSFRLTRELEKIGATPSVVAGREHTCFTIAGTRLNTPEAVELLLDSVLNAKLAFHEVRDVLDLAQAVVADLLKRPEAVLNEVAHRAAFDGGLSTPLLVDPSVLAALTAETLRSYLNARLGAGGLVLAAVGAGHGELVQLASPLLADAAVLVGGGAAPAAPASKYVGGSISVLSATAPLTHTLLAFEAKGGYSDVKGAALAKVVCALLKEGLHAAPTLPHGKQAHNIFKSLEPFSALYQSTGLVGALASSTPSNSGAALDALSKKLEGLAAGASDVVLRQAKNTVISEYRATASTSAGLVQLVGRSLLAGGKFEPNGLPSAVEAISAADVKSYVAQMLASPPTLATYGSLTSLPRYDAIVKRFK